MVGHDLVLLDLNNMHTTTKPLNNIVMSCYWEMLVQVAKLFKMKWKCTFMKIAAPLGASCITIAQ